MITFRDIAKAFNTACDSLVTPDKKHLSINTFGVIEEGAMLNTDN